MKRSLTSVLLALFAASPLAPAEKICGARMGRAGDRFRLRCEAHRISLGIGRERENVPDGVREMDLRG